MYNRASPLTAVKGPFRVWLHEGSMKGTDLGPFELGCSKGRPKRKRKTEHAPRMLEHEKEEENVSKPEHEKEEENV